MHVEVIKVLLILARKKKKLKKEILTMLCVRGVRPISIYEFIKIKIFNNARQY